MKSLCDLKFRSVERSILDEDGTRAELPPAFETFMVTDGLDDCQTLFLHLWLDDVLEIVGADHRF